MSITDIQISQETQIRKKQTRKQEVFRLFTRCLPRIRRRPLLPAVLFLISLVPLMPSPVAREGIYFVDAGQLAVAASRELQNQYALLSLHDDAWKMRIRAFFPTVSLSAFEDDRLVLYGADSFQKNYAVNIEQLLFDGGKLAASMKIEKAKISLSAAQLEIVRGDVFETAISVYRNILALRRMIAIKERGLENMEEQRRIMATRFDLGMALKSELTEADIAISDARISILTSKLELKESEAQFAEMLGTDRVPLLLEKINVQDPIVLPDKSIVRAAALQYNPDLAGALLSVKEKEEEAKLASRVWLPSLSANGSFSIGGHVYPLTKYNWSVGLSIKFDMPWITGNFGASYGQEGRYTQSARTQASTVLLPNPAAAITSKQAGLLLSLERSNYALLSERTGRSAELILERCRYSDEKRIIALQALSLSEDLLALSKIRFDLGEITGLDLLEIHVEFTRKELEVLQCAIEVRSAERQLEKILNLPPGGLNNFAQHNVFIK